MNLARKEFFAQYGDSDQIDKGLDDKHDRVRSVAIEHPNATQEHINKALNDENESVRLMAKKRKNENI